MSKLDRNEYALLELMALEPLSVIPPMHQATAAQLAERGLTVRRGTCWMATTAGLKLVGRLPH